LCTFSRHIKGGFFNYQYLGQGTTSTSNARYKITLTVYMDCAASGNQIDKNLNFTFFSGTTANQYAVINVAQTSTYLLQKLYDDPCITGDQAVCFYRIVTYVLNSFELPPSADGYTISYQRCCRIENMDNIIGSGTVGNTYTIQIPGTSSPVPDAIKNSSPNFPINDTVVICQNSYFKYSFSASDPNGDSLSYAFCTSYIGGSTTDIAPQISSPPPYSSVPYNSNYNGSSPLGSKVTINAKTGLISGTAPPIINTGEYAVTVCVSEFRNGIYLAQTRKELHIRVRDCTVTTAFLNPIPATCNGYAVNFSNDATNPSGTDYLWSFGEPLSGDLNSSTAATPSHTYSDTGVYILKLRVSISGICADSTTIQVKIYPGFFPGYKADAPLCKGASIQFMDTTKSLYGGPNKWQWNFGDLSSTKDTSIISNPVYTYPDSGTYHVQFIVATNFGCVDTIRKAIYINNSPKINLIPHDTLMCNIDTIQLKVLNAGSYSWSPNYNINDVTSQNPFVSPQYNTTYFIKFTDLNGCINTDSSHVNVVDHVTISAWADTTICRTDGVYINAVSDALHYVWTPDIYLDNATKKSPFANPLVATITYNVEGSIGKCSSTANVTIKTLPYADAQAGADTTICFGKSAPLVASGGDIYHWSPGTFLSNSNIANPVAIKPTATTQYIVGVIKIGGCPKPKFDTVILNVDPFISVDAGPQDTTAVLGEPLQLTGSGGITYLWSPSTWLNNPQISNPVALPEDDITYNLIAISLAGCQNSDSIHVKLYKVPPSFYVPTAFSPNNDNNNDILKPILLGIRTFYYFRVYDRWGQLLFTTSEKGKGWDGTFKGKPQDPGTFVWMASGTTFLNQTIIRKGYAVLVR